MIICSRCKAENEDGGKFCGNCGNDLSVNVDAPAQDDLRKLAEQLNSQRIETQSQPFNLNKAIVEIPQKIGHGIKNSIFFRKKKNTIITLISTVVLLVLITLLLNLGYIVFTINFNSENYDLAKDVKEWSINSDDIKESIDKFVLGKMEDYYADFADEKISYEDVIIKLDKANEFVVNTEFKDKVEELQKSRIAFKNAQEYESQNKMYYAIFEYLKVIEADKNYNIAQEKIETNKNAVKNEALEKMKDCKEVNDFEGGLNIVASIEKLFTDDAEINNYKKHFETKKEEYRIAKLKEEQKIKVTSAYTYNDGYYYVFRKGVAVVKNVSDQVVKDLTYVVLQFDSNGYPVKADYSIYAEYGASNSVRIGVESCNIQPGKSYGSNKYCDLSDNATKIKVCVKSATFYDGTTWNNPYYSYWLENEKNRY